MKGAAVAMAPTRREELGFGLLGLLQSEIRRDGDKGIQLRVKFDDTGEDEFGEFDGGEFALAEEAGDFFDGGEGQLGVGCGRHRRFGGNEEFSTAVEGGTI